jgi:hypothetical protein
VAHRPLDTFDRERPEAQLKLDRPFF